MSYVAGVHRFINDGFINYHCGKVWIKAIARGQQIRDDDPLLIKLRKELVKCDRQPIRHEFSATRIRGILTEYLLYRKSLPIVVVTKEGDEIPCHRSFFKKEVKGSLKPNAKVSLVHTRTQDLMAALLAAYSNVPMTFEYLKKNYFWLIDTTTLLNKVYGVWIANIGLAEKSPEFFKKVLNACIAEKLVDAEGLRSIRRSMGIRPGVRIDVEQLPAKIEIDCLKKSTAEGIRRCLRSFEQTHLILNHPFTTEPCPQFQALLKDIRAQNSTSTLKIEHSPHHAQDKKALNDFIIANRSVDTLIVSIEHYDEGEIKSLLGALEQSACIEDFQCDIGAARHLPRELKAQLRLHDWCVIDMMLEIISELKAYDPKMRLLDQDFRAMRFAELAKNIVIFYKIFDKMLSYQVLEKSERALKVYCSMMNTFPELGRSVNFYFCVPPKSSVDQKREKAQEPIDLSMFKNPIVLDCRLAAMHSLHWGRKEIIVYEPNDRVLVSRLIAFAKSGELQIADQYDAQDLYECASRLLAHKAIEKIESWVTKKIEQQSSFLDLHALYLEHKLHAPSTIKPFFGEHRIEINNQTATVCYSSDGRLFISLETLPTEIKRPLLRVFAIGFKSRLHIGSLREDGWKWLKEVLVRYPDAETELTLPPEPYITRDLKNIPQKLLKMG